MLRKIKAELDAKTIKMYIDLHTSIGLPFEVTLTNYTTHIKSARYDIHFMKNAQSNRVFVAYQKIKKDVTGKYVDDINPTILKYYQTNFNFLEVYADKIYNIDLKSAYATIMYNDGYFSLDTFAYICALPKLERLAAVGMLAGRKNVFQFNSQGQIESSEEIVSPTSNYFFHAVKRTYEIIDVCKVELGNNFLFSWVDGIYFVGKENGHKIQELLEKDFKLKSSFDELTEFEIQKKKDYYLLSYIKDEERKVFNIPFPSAAVKQQLYNYLLNKKYNQDYAIADPI